jgi:hypothetical protein
MRAGRARPVHTPVHTWNRGTLIAMESSPGDRVRARLNELRVGPMPIEPGFGPIADHSNTGSRPNVGFGLDSAQRLYCSRR